MKYIYIIIALLLLGGIIYLVMNRPDSLPTPNVGGASAEATIMPITHATFVLEWGDTTVYVDPTGGAAAFAGQSPADLVLITDIHGDHFDPETLAAVSGSAPLIVPQAVYDELPVELAARAQIMNNNESAEVMGLMLTAIPMYNLPDADNADRHPEGRGNGYLVQRDGFRVYIAGDTAGTPEMRALTDIDIALVPMNLPYTMSVEEAADAVLAFKPRQVYPYHYRTPDGLSDVNHFKELVDAGNAGIEVILTQWYPEEEKG